MNRREYREYLKSSYWREARKNFLQEAGKKCRCGSKHNLEIHHKHYNSLFLETFNDVLVLCQKCHAREHNIPKKVTKAKRRKRHFDGLAASLERKIEKGKLHSKKRSVVSGMFGASLR